MVKISPSILSCDFSNLELEIRKIQEAGADMLHVDVMDGHFVNNISIGPIVISSVRKKTNLVFDVHLMMSRPDLYLDNFIDSGADIITIHYESDCDIKETLTRIKAAGKLAGLALKPATAPEVVLGYLDILDMILVMTVEPGFGGQKFMFEMLPKIKKIRRYIEQSGKDIDLEVDGGIDQLTKIEAVGSGANVIVAGSYIFKSDDYLNKIKSLR